LLEETLKALKSFQIKNNLSPICVIGDLMLDVYYFGEVNRISPEAPVPIVKVVNETKTMGGAANVANNIAHLNTQSVLIGITGNDPTASELEKLASEKKITPIFIKGELPTITKCRIIGAHQQMLRLDFEGNRLNAPEMGKLLQFQVNKYIKNSGVVILSDYGKGVCSRELCTSVIRQATRLKIPTIVDPKSDDWSKYAGVTYIKPNFKELCQAIGRSIPNEESSITIACRELIKKYRIKNILLTRSEAGISLISSSNAHHFHSKAREVFDVSGAGDTVVATFAVAILNEYDVLEAVEIANTAAGIVVAKVGTQPIELSELQKILNLSNKNKNQV
jgi:D-beta-D-heptose 7-phosphate kinase/D-beta-D-heptose 1-phosphate adenosyltransferase